MAEKMLSAKDIAARFGVSNSTARGWLLRGRFAGAQLVQPEIGVPYWVAPEGAVKAFVPPKPGPVPKNPADTTRAMNSAFKKATEAERKPTKRRGRKAA
jgi:hypothetical protein